MDNKESVVPAPPLISLASGRGGREGGKPGSRKRSWLSSRRQAGGNIPHPSTRGRSNFDELPIFYTHNPVHVNFSESWKIFQWNRK